MKFLFFAILGLAFFAADNVFAGDLYKCVKDGRTSYQSTPCDTTSKATQVQTAAASSMLGCYVADMPGFENGFQVKRTGNDSFTLETSSGKDKLNLPMKTSTPQELRDIGSTFHLTLREGVSMKWDKDTPNQKPIGLYKGKDAAGKDMVFAFFFLANGPAIATQCR